MRTRHLVLFLVFGCASLALLAGCTPADPRGKLTGTVTYRKQPLPGGFLIVTTEDGKKSERIELEENGAFSSSHVPIGKLRAAVEPAPKSMAELVPKGVKVNIPKDAPVPDNYKGGGKGKYVPIPEFYRDPDTSGLTFNMEPGEHTWNIELKDSK